MARIGVAARQTVWLCALALNTSPAIAQNDSKGSAEKQGQPRLELYGRLTTNLIQDFNQNNPLFFDVLRTTKLPAFPDEFGENGRFYFSVRPSFFGVKPVLPTELGDLKGIFEFDLFGSGRDAGRTMFHMQLAYVELGKFGIGKYDSPFMDMDVFPTSLEHWGPPGIVFFQNIQFRYMPIQGDSRVTVAIERTSASGDRGDGDDLLIDLENIVGRFPLPALSAEGRLGGSWGFVELAGILRRIEWDDLLPFNQFDLDGGATGWGFTLSSRLKAIERDWLKLQVTYGEAIQDYLDAPFDIGAQFNPGSLRRPLIGVPLPVFAMLAFYELRWSEKFSTTLGYSRIDVDNSDAQSSLAFQTGQYALINLLYHPTSSLRVGGEFQWGRRDNAFNDFDVNDFRLQFQARYSYSYHIGNNPAANDGK